MAVTFPFLRLAVEIQLIIAERIENIADIVSLSQCSRGLRAVAWRSLPGWLRLLQEGIPSSCFTHREVRVLCNLVEGKV
jgi:hypothetical protein